MFYWNIEKHDLKLKNYKNARDIWYKLWGGGDRVLASLNITHILIKTLKFEVLSIKGF